MSKLTALQLFVDKITNNHDQHFKDFYKAEIEEALEMEQEQMKEMYVKGIKNYDPTYGGKDE